MRRLLTYFFRGLVFLAPVAVTVYVCVWLFQLIDGWLGIPIPGVGFIATLALITLFGFLASNLITRGVFSMLDRLLNRLPFVRLLYSSSRDLVNAFVGEKRRFDKPVFIRIVPDGHARMLGFVTQESLSQLGQPGHVSVYVPQSYNWAGQIWVLPTSSVERIDASSAAVMAFVVSGGVTEVPALEKEQPAVPPAVGTP